MFEGIGEIFTAWRSVLHLAEWTGLSLSALAGCAAGLYFGWQLPLVRRLLLLAAFGTVMLWAGLIHGGSVERRDVMAEWNAAKIKAAREAKARDIEIEMKIRSEYLAELTGLDREADGRKQQIDDLERERNAHKSRADSLEHAMVNMPSGNACVLSPAAFRLRRDPKP